MSPSLFMGYLNSLSLDRQFSQYIYKVFLDGFVILDGLREGNVYHFIVVNAYHDIALSFHDGVDTGRKSRLRPRSGRERRWKSNSRKF